VISALIRGLETAAQDEKDGDGVATDVLDGAAAVVSPNIPSHTFIVKDVTNGGNIECFEYTYPYDPATANKGANIFNLTEEYNLKPLGDHLIAIVRPPCLDDNEELQAEATAMLEQFWREGADYGILNLIADMGIGKIDYNKFVCIQGSLRFLIWLQQKTGSFKLPDAFIINDNGTIRQNVVDLETVLAWCQNQGWGKQLTKEIPDGDPTVELEAPLSQQIKNC
jgi:hypothetical protein